MPLALVRSRSWSGCARAPARLAAIAFLAGASVAPLPSAAREVCTGRAPPAPESRRPEDMGKMLEALGVWLEAPRHGRVWQPCGVDAEWRPYFHGSWTWTEDGWFWVSEEPWGWATYHYGRWHFDEGLGWVWQPGRTWAPAWVAWRWNGDVVGWSPLGGGGTLRSAFWTFVPASRLAGQRVETIAIPGPRVPALLLKTRSPAGSSRSARLTPPPPSLPDQGRARLRTAAAPSG